MFMSCDPFSDIMCAPVKFLESRCSHRGLCAPVLSGGEASGAGQAGFPQHTQEADRLSAGPAGRGRGQEVRQVALGERQPRD